MNDKSEVNIVLANFPKPTINIFIYLLSIFRSLLIK